MNQQRVVVSGLAAAVFVLVSLAWNYIAGKDMNWDFMNYHFYGAAAMVDGRLAQDYFAASIQSYLNPLPYVPQFLMMRWGWHSLLIGSVLTLVHTLNLWLVWKITRLLVPAQSVWSDAFYILLLATALAFVSPVHLTELGTSFADILTSLPVLWGLYLLLKSGDQIDLKTLAWSGLLFGLATGAKLTNGTLAASGFVLAVWLLWQGGGLRHVVRGAFWFGLFGVLGTLLTLGYWSYQLWAEFGNPVFPLFNAFVGSPDFLQTSYQDRRFLGEGWAGLLTLPFQMPLLEPWIYTENISVDVRVAALAVVLLLTVMVMAYKRRQGVGLNASASTTVAQQVVGLTLFCVVAYVLWGSVFRIGRYAYVIWILVGPLLGGLLLMAFNAKVSRSVMLLVLLIQGFVLYNAGTPRWTPSQWTPEWLPVTVPNELKEKPHTVFTIGTLSYSAFVPYLHPETSAINLVGQYNQPAGERMSEKLKAHLDKPADILRVVYRDGSHVEPFAQPPTRVRQDLDAILSLYGLKLAPQDCQEIRIHFESIQGTLLSKAPEPIDDTPKVHGDRLVSCSVLKLDALEREAARQALAPIDALFDRVERACGKKLSPHNGQTLRGINGWLRNYFNSMNSVATDGSVVYIRPFRSMVDFDLGTASSWKDDNLGGKSQVCPDLPTSMRVE